MNKEKENKNAEISARITEILQYTGDTRNGFAVKLGYERAQTVYDVINMKSAPSYDFFRRFSISEYSDIIDLKWLLTGEGAMLRTNDVSTPEPLPSINQEYKGAPYYNVDFIGGFEFVSNDQTQLPDYYINYPPYNKPGVMWCNLTGHSMEPEISNGDVIALKEVRSPIEYLPAGEIYGIITDDYRTVKRIRPGAQKGFVRLIPANKSPEFCEQEIPVEMIRRVFAVLGSIRKFF